MDFVDAADPDDLALPPNFGVFSFVCEPNDWSTDPRLPALLRWLADLVESDQAPLESYVFSSRWRDFRGRTFDVAAGRERLERELFREVGPGHQLENLETRAVASCMHCDDTIFELDDEYAVVHLTWLHEGPDRPPAPVTTIYQSWTAVASYLRGHDAE